MPETKDLVEAADQHANAAETPSRLELLARARSFLTSPQIQHQDTEAKRRFLTEKGLTNAEIDGLLQDLPQQLPVVPPRTYPPLPPSNLPNLLIGLVRLVSWLAGGSAAVTFMYYRFLLPLITHSYHARSSLISHHTGLLQNLTATISSFKESQAESFSVLPRPRPDKEDIEHSESTPPSPSPLVISLTNLSTSLPPKSLVQEQNLHQETLQTLSRFTGYLTTQLYSLPGVLSFRAPGLGVSVTLGPAEEELRREIRALKGLVLNRRSFMPAVTPGSTLTVTPPSLDPLWATTSEVIVDILDLLREEQQLDQSRILLW